MDILSTLGLAEIKEALMNSPELRAVVARRETDRLADRQRRVDRITAARAAHEKTAEKHRVTCQAKREDVTKAEAALVSKQQALRQAESARQQENWAFDRTVRTEEAVLRESADPRIPELVSELRRMVDRERHTLPMIEERNRTFNGEGYDYETYTNNENKRTYLALIRSSISVVEAWTLEALTAEEVTERIQALRGEIKAAKARTNEVATPVEAA